MVDYSTISSLATAGGTLVLAVVTLAAVRSANRSARIAERSMLAGLRPLLLTSRLQDPEQKVGFVDNHWVRLPGGYATAEVTEDVIYLTMSVRNAGSGLALMHGWSVVRMVAGPGPDPLKPADFRRLSRDLYVAGGDIGFWQGAIRSVEDADDTWLRERIEAGERVTIDVLYGDQEGAERVISRFSMSRVAESDRWLATVARHWYPDRPDPR